MSHAHFTRPLTAAVLLSVCLLFSTEILGSQRVFVSAATGGTDGLLWLQMHDYLLFRVDYLEEHGIAPTYENTVSTCLDNGGTPATDPNTAIKNAIANRLMAYWPTDKGLTFFTGSNARPSDENPNQCRELTQGSDGDGLSSMHCYYRYRFGFYDMYSYNEEPGTAYWRGLYLEDDPATQVLNSYEQQEWNASLTADYGRYPHGYFATVSGINPKYALLLRMDSPEVAEHNDPNPLGMYVIVCEVQLYPILQYASTRMPQPDFVQGWKDLTWPQENWWIIFLIIAVLLVALLVFIFVYCTCTSREKATDLPIYSLVVRESVGMGYTVVDGDDKIIKRTIKHPNQANNNMEMYDMQNPLGPRSMRQGFGFNPSMPGDPEDGLRRVPSIFGKNDTNMHTDGNAFAGQGKANQGEEADLDGDAVVVMREETKKKKEPEPEPEPEPVPPPPPPEPVQRPPSPVPEVEARNSPTLHRRKSSRRGRGRTTSQMFSDVEVPQAQEINETNIDL